MTLAENYQRLCNTPSDIWLHLPRLAALVEEHHAQHVIELGTRRGASTVAFLHALEATGGRLTSIDLDPPPALKHDRWDFIQGDDLDPRVVSTLPPAQVVFIDTTHHYEQTMAELHVYRYLVEPGGVIACHDTQLERPPRSPAYPTFPVRHAIEEFCNTEGFQWTEYPDCFGLGIINVA